MINVHVRRSKLRRFFETEMRSTNTSIRSKCAEFSKYFFIRFSPHMIDRLTDRHIDEHEIMALFNKIPDNASGVMEFLNMNDRPLRLEITDGSLWLGFTVDTIDDDKGYYGLCCRMIIKNDHRLPGKTSTHLMRI